MKSPVFPDEAAAVESHETAAFEPPAGLLRRLASTVYEALLLAAILMAVAFPFLFFFRNTGSPWFRPLFQCYLLVITGSYFIWCWAHGGQTLAMKTWRLRLVHSDGRRITLRLAVTRFLFAVVGAGLAGAGFVWALVDRDRQFLHDRLAGTKIVLSPKS